MRFYYLILSLFPLLLSAQKSIQNENKKATFEYKKSTGPSLGIGVLGMKSKKAFAILVNEKFYEKKDLIFNQVKFQTMNFSNKDAAIYLCIFENNNGLPGKLIKNGKLLVEVPPKKNVILADLSSLNIKVPTNGYFIGFEWILSKENAFSGNYKTSDMAFNPTIDGTSSGESNLFVFDKIWKKQEKELVSTLKFEITYLK